MAKILIASIGTGGYDREKKQKSYNSALYYKDDDNFVETAYIAEAMKKFYGVDKCILLGTSGSAWHGFYLRLFEENSEICAVDEYCEDYFFTLLELYESKDKHLLDIGETAEKLKPLKTALGDFCESLVVLKYGFNQDEIMENFRILSETVGNKVNDGDEIFFDITHSFRSLAFYELLAVNYLKDVLKRGVKISFVSYGMFDAVERGKPVPIVNLSPLINLADWIKAAEEYRRFGTAYLLAEILEDNSDLIGLGKEESKALKRLGDVVTANNFKEFKKLVKNCTRTVQAVNAGLKTENLVFGFIFRDIAERFGGKLDDDILLSMELSKWHYDKHRYLAAAITIVEGILDYCEQVSGYRKEIESDCLRNRVLNIHFPGNSFIGDFRAKYNAARKIRNKLSHAQELCKADLNELRELGKLFYTVYERHFKGNDENERALACAIKNAL